MCFLYHALLPTSLLLLEVFERFFQRRSIFIVLHGELKGLIDPTKKIFGELDIGQISGHHSEGNQATFQVVVS